MGNGIKSMTTDTDGLCLYDHNGNLFDLDKETNPYCVVYFYPKDMTSQCTNQAIDFSSSFDAFVQLGCQIAGISPDSAKKHQAFVEKYELPFPLLVDPEQKIAKQYNVWQQKSMYGRQYMGIVRTTLLFGPGSALIKRWDNVKVKGHVEAVLQCVQEALGH